MPWVKEEKKHKCKFPLFWKLKELGREWECPICRTIWRIYIAPFGEKRMVPVSVLDC